MNETLHEKIEKYISGEMSSEERAGFEKEMSGNDELRSYFDLYKTIETEMQGYNEDEDDEAELKNSLEKLNEKYFNASQNSAVSEAEVYRQGNGKIRKIALWKKLAVAASIIGVVAVTAPLFFQKKKETVPVAANKNTDASGKSNNSPKDIISPGDNVKVNDKNSQPLDNTVHELSKTMLNVLFKKNFQMDAVPEDEESLLAEAFEIIKSRDYANAIDAIDEAKTFTTRGLQSDSALTAFYADYYKALCYMADNNVYKAIPELKLAVANNYADSLRIKAQWYLSLAYLKAGDMKKTDSLLKVVAVNKTMPGYKLKAQKLLNDFKTEK
jgi:hypothetical protein